MSHNNKKDVSLYKHWFAGACAGVADIWACQGLDRIKTHMQNNIGKSVFTSTKEVLAKGGIKALYEGVWPMTIKSSVSVGLRYYMFAFFADTWKSNFQKDKTGATSTMGNFFAGAATGVVEAVTLSIPAELLKVRHMTQAKHEAFTTVLGKIIKEEGILALYKGGTFTLLRNVTNHMLRFPMYFSMSEYFKKRRNEKNLPSWLNLTLGGAAGGLATLINAPLDTIKTRIQKQGQTLSGPQVIANIYKEAGIRGYWAGVMPCILRVAPGQAIVFATYEKVLQLLEK